MHFRTILSILLTFSFVFLTVGLVYAQAKPEEGKNYIWIDLGKKNEGLLLTQAEQGDGITEPDVQANVDCRKLPYPYAGPGHNHMYFRIDDSFIFGGDNEVWIVMEYYDLGDNINCQYDSNGAGPVDGAFRGSGDGAFASLKPTNTEKWLFHTWYIKDGRFENRGNGSDFRFSTHAAGDMWVNRVWIILFEPGDPFDPENLSQSKAVQPGNKTAVTWGMLKLN